MSGVPDEFLTDGWAVIEDTPVCPGCGRELSPGIRQYIAVEFNGETWCRTCVFNDTDAVVESEQELVCPGCYAHTAYRRAAAPTEDGLCDGCGAKFRVSRAKGVVK